MAHGGQEVALDLVEFVKCQVGLGQFVDLLIQVTIHISQFLLHGHQVMQHPVERVREFFKLVTGVNLAANIQLAGRNGV